MKVKEMLAIGESDTLAPSFCKPPWQSLNDKTLFNTSCALNQKGTLSMAILFPFQQFLCDFTSHCTITRL